MWETDREREKGSYIIAEQPHFMLLNSQQTRLTVFDQESWII